MPLDYMPPTNYLPEIIRITREHDENLRNRDVLRSPIFVMLIGIRSTQRKQEIIQELQLRWTSARPFIYVCDLNFHGTRMRLESEMRPTMAIIRMEMREQVTQAHYKKQLGWWFNQIVQHASRALGNLNNSRICVVCDAESVDTPWTARCCMMLNRCLFRLGCPVDERQLFCLLPGNYMPYTAELSRLKDNVIAWRSEVPDEPLFPVIMGNEVTDDLLPCNDCYATTSVFDRYVFLDEVESLNNVVSNRDRIRTMLLLMDAVANVNWPGGKGDCYSAWIYPGYADRGIDIALGWRCLHEEFQRRAVSGAEPPSLASLHKEIIHILKLIATGIPAQMTGFSIYNSRMLTSLQGKTMEATQIEQKVFGDVLHNKFDYLWRCALNKVEAEERPDWDRRVRDALSVVCSSKVIEDNAAFLLNEDDACVPAQQSQRITLERDVNLGKLIPTIASACYSGRHNEKIREYVRSFNKGVEEALERRRRQLERTYERSKRLQGDVNNAEIPFRDALKQGLSDEKDAIARRKTQIEKVIPEELHLAYSQAMSASETEFDDRIVHCLEALHRCFTDPVTNLPPMLLPQPEAGDRVMCRLSGGTPQDGTFAVVPSGINEGLFYYLAKINSVNVLAMQ